MREEENDDEYIRKQQGVANVNFDDEGNWNSEGKRKALVVKNFKGKGPFMRHGNHIKKLSMPSRQKPLDDGDSTESEEEEIESEDSSDSEGEENEEEDKSDVKFNLTKWEEVNEDGELLYRRRYAINELGKITWDSMGDRMMFRDEKGKIVKTQTQRL